MDESINNIINKYGMPLLAVGAAAIIHGGEWRRLPFEIATHLAGHKLSGLTEFELGERLKNVKPEHLNHDIFRVSKSAVKLALKATIDNYQIDDDNRKKIKKKVDEICKQLDDHILNDITVKDIIKYESNITDDGLKWSDAFSEELKATNGIFKDENFDKSFRSYFHLYFGEYLKKDHAAFIAYEREMQKMIFDAINELKGENISEVIKESISKYIKEIPVVTINSEMQEEFQKEFQELKKYFEQKEIVAIFKIDADEIHIEGRPPIDFDYQQLQKVFDGKYQFKYRGDTYYVDQINEETFDYLLGKTKYNQIFTKRIIEAIKSDCYQQYPELYDDIAAEGSAWNTTSLCREGQDMISENFVGIIGEQLFELFAIGDEQGDEKNTKYFEKCRYIVKRTLDLIIFAFLSQLWDDLCNKKIELPDGIPLRKYFPIENHITLLHNLIQIYRKHKTDDTALLIPDILAIADQFDENGELCTTYSKLMKSVDKPDILNCYFAENNLSTFFEKFRFLVNYNIVSMKKIECINIKNVSTNYLHHHDYLGRDKKTNICREMDKPLFSYAVLLYRGNDYIKNINLFPFAIDINALNFDNNVSRIAFINQPVRDKHRLKYTYFDTGKDVDPPVEYKEIIQQKGKDNVVFLTDEEMKIYNKDCVYITFKKIEEQLFI